MKRKLLAAMPLIALAGCTTADELRAKPVAWTATYPVAFDAMANCIALRMVEDAGMARFTVTPQLYQREQRALVTGSSDGWFVIEYSVRQVSERDSEVSLRSAFVNSGLSGSGLARSRAVADRCATAA